MEAGHHFEYRQLATYNVVHDLDALPGLRAACDVGLVGDHDQDQAGLRHLSRCRDDAGQQLEVFDALRRM